MKHEHMLFFFPGFVPTTSCPVSQQFGDDPVTVTSYQKVLKERIALLWQELPLPLSEDLLLLSSVVTGWSGPLRGSRWLVVEAQLPGVLAAQELSVGH